MQIMISEGAEPPDVRAGDRHGRRRRLGLHIILYYVISYIYYSMLYYANT